MKPIETVSIGGFAFSIEDDAAQRCREYLSGLETHYGTLPGAREIMEGIEERMAELLWERTGRDGVVSVANIEDVVSILGQPDQIDREVDMEPAAVADGVAAEKQKGKKRLYRNLSDKIIGGVCSGLGAYFGADTVVFRVAFAILALLPFFFRIFVEWQYFFIPIVYCILWISMPGAKTVEQRYALRGEPLDVEGIRQRVGSDMAAGSGSSQSRNGLGSFGRVLVLLVGAFLLLGGFAGNLGGALALLWHHDLGLDNIIVDGITNMNGFSPALVRVAGRGLTQALLLGAFFLPFVLMLYLGSRLILGFKPPKWHPGLVILLVWLADLVALGVVVFLTVPGMVSML